MIPVTAMSPLFAVGGLNGCQGALERLPQLLDLGGSRSGSMLLHPFTVGQRQGQIRVVADLARPDRHLQSSEGSAGIATAASSWPRLAGAALITTA